MVFFLSTFKLFEFDSSSAVTTLFSLQIILTIIDCFIKYYTKITYQKTAFSLKEII